MPGRDNGFIARHYVPLADLDPRLADAMLDVLRGEGIAAYVVPSTGHLGGYLEVHLPERPRDRLWVDRAHHDRAAVLLSAQSERSDVVTTPDSGEVGSAGANERPIDAFANAGPAGEQTAGDEAADSTDSSDDIWDQLVAGFDLPAPIDTMPWPDAENLSPDTRSAGSPPPAAPSFEILRDIADTAGAVDPRDGSPVPRRIVRPVDRTFGDDGGAAGADITQSGEYDPLSILDEHFVPDAPPPLPRLRVGTRWSLAAIFVGAALIIGRSFSTVVPDAVVLGVLAVMGGFGGLVAMMREDRPSDDDPDDGAVV
jgi:hypothetical protein